MRRLNIVVLPGVFIITVAILLFRTEVTSIASPSSSPKNCGVWSSVASPNVGTGSNFLYSVAAISSSNVWAVGEYGNGNGSSTLVEYWNGKKWGVVASPNVSGATENTLAGVTAIAANNVWAVGSSTTSNFVRQTLIEHWNGRQWSIVASPNVAALDNGLTAVSAVSATDVWAVGTSSGTNGYQTLIEHWNGTSWRIVSNPGVGMLNGVAAIATNNVWAVGSRASTNNIQTLIEHWDGRQWNVVASAGPGLASNTLSAVAAISANNIWAVGDFSNSVGPHAPYSPLIEHWNGKAWSIVASPTQGTSDLIGGIAAVSASNIWVVGDYTRDIDPAFGTYLTLIEHWNGTAWSVVNSPSPGSIASDLVSAAAIPKTGKVWAAGFVQNDTAYQTLTEFYC
jgi:hypothetical protein